MARKNRVQWGIPIIISNFTFKRFSGRLFFFFLSLFLIVGTAAFWSITSVMEANAVEQIKSELANTGEILESIISSRNLLLIQASYILSRDYAFQQAFSTDDKPTVKSALESLRSRVKADVIKLLEVDEPYSLMVESGAIANHAGAFPYPELIQQAEETGKPQSSFVIFDKKLFSVVLIPLLAPDPIAWFCIGFQIDDKFTQDLLKFTNNQISMVETLPENVHFLHATTLPESFRMPLLSCVDSLSDPDVEKTIKFGNERYIMVARTLKSSTKIQMVCQRSLEEALRPLFKVQRLFFLISLASLLMVIIGVKIVSRMVTTPVLALVKGTRKIEAGEFGEEIKIDLQDEIGELANSFNSMTRGLAEKEKLRGLLGKVVSGPIAEEMLKKKEILLGGEEKHATILFSDIRGFTTLSENRPPTEILRLLNHYLTRMCDIIEAKGGVIDKFVGDAIMAIFGAPITSENDADNAILAAIAMISELENINREFSEMGLPNIKIGVGINSGSVVAGNMGSKNRLNYTVIGDEVNLASRLESLTKEYGQNIIISQNTLSETHLNFSSVNLGEVTVKGKSEATKIFGITGYEKESGSD